MTIRLGSNDLSLTIQRHLNTSTQQLTASMEKLSTGLRINSAKDDPSGLAIAEKMRAKVNGLGVAEDNIQQALNLLGSAEGALNAMLAQVQDFRDLGVAASTGTISDFAPFTTASQGIRDAITKVSDSAEFNGNVLLNGSKTSYVIQVGADTGAANQMTLAGGVFADIDSTSLSLDNITDTTTANNAITDADAAITTITNKLSQIGAYQNALQAQLEVTQNTRSNYQAAEANIREVDVAEETANLTRLQVIQQASAAMLAQANQNSQIGLALLG